MVLHINPDNPQGRLITRVVETLKQGGVIAYPTDTNWGIGCSVHSSRGIEKIRRLKGNFQDRTLTVICQNISQASDLVEINTFTYKILKKYMPGPFVFILPAKKNIEKKINMKRFEIGVRIPSNPVSVKIVEGLNCPIFSVTASKVMTSQGWLDDTYTEENLFECGWELEEINEIDLIIDTGESLAKELSTVIQLSDKEINILRQGVGKFYPP